MIGKSEQTVGRLGQTGEFSFAKSYNICEEGKDHANHNTVGGFHNRIQKSHPQNQIDNKLRHTDQNYEIHRQKEKKIMDKMPVFIEDKLKYIMDYLTQSIAGVLVQDTEKETITYISDSGDKYTANCRMDSSRACVKDFCSQIISKFPL